MFDEQPDGDIHGECAAEIHRQECEITRLRAEQTRLKEHVEQLQRIIREEATDSAQVILERDTLALQNKRYREVLLKLACLGNGEQYGNSVGNCIAQDALSLPDLSTSIIQQHDNDVIERCAHECEEFADAYLRTSQGNNDGMYDHMESAARELAEAIRALKW